MKHIKKHGKTIEIMYKSRITYDIIVNIETLYMD